MPKDIVWKIVMRRGMNVLFACGHRQGRKAAFLCETPATRAIFVRRVARPRAEEHPCHACLLTALSGRAPERAEGFEGLVRLEDAAAAIVASQKNRLN